MRRMWSWTTVRHQFAAIFSTSVQWNPSTRDKRLFPPDVIRFVTYRMSYGISVVRLAYASRRDPYAHECTRERWFCGPGFAALRCAAYNTTCSGGSLRGDPRGREGPPRLLRERNGPIRNQFHPEWCVKGTANGDLRYARLLDFHFSVLSKAAKRGLV